MSGIAILKLQRAGFTEQQVEALADYFDSRAAMKTTAARPGGELSAKCLDLDHSIERFGRDLTRAIERFGRDIELRIAENKAETIRWVVGVGFAQVAMILAVLRLFPSVHP